MAADDFIDPGVDLTARLIAIEHAMAVQWYTFGCNQADRLGLTVTEVVEAFRDGVCGSLLDGPAALPPAMRDLVREHAARQMEHALGMARLNDKLVAAQKAKPA